MPRPKTKPAVSAEALDHFLTRREKSSPVEMLAAFGAHSMRQGWHRAAPAQWERRLSDFANSNP